MDSTQQIIIPLILQPAVVKVLSNGMYYKPGAKHPRDSLCILPVTLHSKWTRLFWTQEEHAVSFYTVNLDSL